MAESEPFSRRFFNAMMGLGFVGTLGGLAGTALAYLWPMPDAVTTSEFLSTTRGKVAGAELGENEGW